ncbi:MAG TPA: hypothetical protein PKI35_03900 [Bacteroidales bacterium]|nr:hypothetical protein [Bacteroidales bacterium]
MGCVSCFSTLLSDQDFPTMSGFRLRLHFSSWSDGMRLLFFNLVVRPGFPDNVGIPASPSLLILVGWDASPVFQPCCPTRIRT